MGIVIAMGTDNGQARDADIEGVLRLLAELVDMGAVPTELTVGSCSVRLSSVRRPDQADAPVQSNVRGYIARAQAERSKREGS